MLSLGWLLSLGGRIEYFKDITPNPGGHKILERRFPPFWSRLFVDVIVRNVDRVAKTRARRHLSRQNLGESSILELKCDNVALFFERKFDVIVRNDDS